MAKSSEELPQWVIEEIQTAKFEKSVSLARTGYILEIYYKDNKIDAQLYEPVEDGRHIVTMDLSKDIKSKDLKKGIVYEFTLESRKAPLSDKAVQFLKKEKDLDMSAIYQFQLNQVESLYVGSSQTTEMEAE